MAAGATRSRRADAAALVGWVGVSQLAGVVGLPFTGSEPGGWYDRLDKAAFHPPDSVFGPVWIVLYAVIGVAAWLVWRQRPSLDRTAALWLFGGQLVLNALWTPLFFGLERPTLALVEIGMLFVAAVAALWAFLEVDRRAGLLLVPYVAWIAFATLLNAAIVSLN